MAVAKFSLDTQAYHSSNLFWQWQETLGVDKALHLKQLGMVKPAVTPGNLPNDA